LIHAVDAVDVMGLVNLHEDVKKGTDTLYLCPGYLSRGFRFWFVALVAIETKSLLE